MNKTTIVIIVLLVILHVGGVFFAKSCIDFYTCQTTRCLAESIVDKEHTLQFIDNNAEIPALMDISCSINIVVQRHSLDLKLHKIFQLLCRLQQYRKITLSIFDLNHILFSEKLFRGYLPIHYYIFSLRKIII